MFTRRTGLVMSFVIALLLLAGIGTGSGAIAHGLMSAQPGVTIPYPGQLRNASGQPVPDGAYSFIFDVYDSEDGGTRLWSETQQNVLLRGGTFAVTLGAINSLPMEKPEEGKRWLGIAVRGPGDSGFTALTPRQPLGASSCGASPAAPAAAGAACPHDHFGEQWTGSSSTYGLRVTNNGGSGLLGESSVSGGIGVYGASNSSTGSGAGVRGYSYSPNGVGGYFYNDYGGVGMKATGTSGNAVVGVSDSGNGVVGRSGSGLLNIPQGGYGVIGQSTWVGVMGVSNDSNGLGMYSDGDMDIYGSLWILHGLQVDGLATFQGGKSGFVVDVAQNDDTVPLTLGDVVVVSGAGPAVLGEIPVINVRRASAARLNGVVGVVDQHFTPPQKQKMAPSEKNPSSADYAPAQPGSYITVVTLGAFKAIKVDASGGTINPGDLLVASSNPGYAVRATDPKPGTIIGKALGTLTSGTGVVPVIITLQ